MARLSGDRFQVGANWASDTDYLLREAKVQTKDSPELSVQVHDITGATCCIGLWGPLSPDVISGLSSDDLSTRVLPYSTLTPAKVGGIPVTAFALSAVGELGWEIHTSAEYGQYLWEMIYQAGQAYGLIAAGRGAYYSLRLEKGYRLWGADMTTEHDPFEAGLSAAIDLTKEDYVGQTVVSGLSKTTPSKKLRCLVVQDGESMILGKEPVFVGDQVKGYVTTAAFGFTIGKPIAFAYLQQDVDIGHEVEVEYFGKRIKATVSREPLYDPHMSRLKGFRTAHKL